jgi:hypothetical protein
MDGPIFSNDEMQMTFASMTFRYVISSGCDGCDLKGNDHDSSHCNRYGQHVAFKDGLSVLFRCVRSARNDNKSGAWVLSGLALPKQNLPEQSELEVEIINQMLG